MSKGLKTGITALSAILAVAGIIFTLLAVRDHLSINTDIALIISYVLAGLCALGAVGAGILAVFTNLKKNMKVIYSILAVAAVFLVGYIMASDVVLPSWSNVGFDVDEGVSRSSGMGIIASYVFAGIAVGSIIFFEIKNVFK